MVDFDKLRTKKSKPKAVEPLEIFRRLPKPPGINDLYTSQAAVLQEWHGRRDERDTVLKLHTGGGKTLVGLLIAQSTLNETCQPVLYLTPTVQLVNQTIEKAKALGISVVPYEKRQPLNDKFTNGSAIMVATYKALFNGKSKFGLRGSASQPQNVAAIILDDAHSAFSVIRESFTLTVSSKDSRDRYESLAGLFRKSFKDIDRIGTFDDILAGNEYAVLEVPYWAWNEQLDAVQEQLKSDADNYPLIWPLLRDKLQLCHALISRDAFTITPILPLVDAFPSFIDADRRIYMSATIADDSEIIRTFDAAPKSIQTALTSRSLAGISERMILIPELMPFKFSLKEAETVSSWAAKQNYGAVVLVSSDKAAERWSDVAEIANGSEQVEKLVADLQERRTSGPVVFANRYDGIDLPGNSCRLLIMSGLPTGTSNYELFRANALYGGATITRLLAQRIEQGIGRGARGAGDHCVVLLIGPDLTAWVANEANFRFLTSATRAQLEMGTNVSKEVKSLKELGQTIQRSLTRDQDWVEYHAESLAELVDEALPNEQTIDKTAAVERKALNLWQDGYYSQAIAKIEALLASSTSIDPQTRGWMQQLAARIADSWGHPDRAEDWQRQAYAHNRNLIRPKVLPPYMPLSAPGKQAKAIAAQLDTYRMRRGVLKRLDEVTARLHHHSSANQFEQALVDLGNMIGVSAERFDNNGKGPDVLWILPDQVGFVIEAKSRKKDKNGLTKEEHGQLLVAAEWFVKNYPGYNCVRVSVHPQNNATEAAVAGASYALTYENLAALISEFRALLTNLCESQLSLSDLENKCDQLLAQSSLNFNCLKENYLVTFESQSDFVPVDENTQD